MITLKGKYASAKVFTDTIEQKTISQIIEFCNYKFLQGSNIAIMPDCHPGNDCVIGTTLQLTNRIIPNLVGVDVGCGVIVVKIKEKDIDLEKLDKIAHELVPVGKGIRSKIHPYISKINLGALHCGKKVGHREPASFKRAQLSLGTLGGGNHFIEVDKDEDGNLYLLIHSGSRHLGVEINRYYQRLAYDHIYDHRIRQTILDMHKAGRVKEIATVTDELSKTRKKLKSIISSSTAYVQHEDFSNYLHDMNITQQYATYNRKAIADVIIKALNLTVIDEFTVIHNYIDVQNMILRKGAISAQKGEKVIIPLNMRDGAILGVGKGNPDWNFSAPHGAGRIMSRGEAKDKVSLEQFKESMKDIFTSSVNNSTRDEAPDVYKPMQSIVDTIGDTVDIQSLLKPIYNFKESSDDDEEALEI